MPRVSLGQFTFEDGHCVTQPHLPALPETLSFASELIRARSELQMTQSQLAEASGLSVSAIKAYEVGRNLPGARELRALCQALQVSPNKLLFGTELPFEQRTLANMLVDGETEDEHVARARSMILLSLLAQDEKEAVITLARSIAIARHGVEKVKEALTAADIFAGLGREFAQQTRDALNANKPVNPAAFVENVEGFMKRQGHDLEPEKLPKK